MAYELHDDCLPGPAIDQHATVSSTSFYLWKGEEDAVKALVEVACGSVAGHRRCADPHPKSRRANEK